MPQPQNRQRRELAAQNRQRRELAVLKAAEQVAGMTRDGAANYWNGQAPECAINMHVFGCRHVTTCLCGKATRQPEPPARVICASCGKED